MKILLLAMAFAVPVAGCATVTRGTTSQIQLRSEPSGAEARTSLNHSCTTPCTIKVERKAEFSVTFRKPGFHDEIIEVKTEIAGRGAAGFAGNVILGGVAGMAVDAYTGAALNHVPNPVQATLQPLGSAPQARPRAGDRRELRDNRREPGRSRPAS